MKIVTVVGARPQFIKAAPLSRSLRAVAGVREVLVHTGQHYDATMSDIFFQELDLPAPDYHLGVGSGSHASQTAAMLTGIEAVLEAEQPAGVLIYGDTNSTLAAALAAAKLHLRVAHVEAGLRSYNRAMPEEINRVVADALAALLFCPSAVSAANLAREGITAGVHVVGDVMYDAVLHAADRAQSTIAAGLLRELGVAPRGYILATVHRAANTDDPAPLNAIVTALNALAEPVIFPVHPRTAKALAALPITLAAHVQTIAPVGYLAMVALESQARLILTDSGGVQKEAYWLAVPCVTLREETEWVETVAAGWNRVVGTDPVRIAAAVADSYPAGPPPPLYGDGHAAEQIAAIVTAAWGP
ncbi:MAG TPA: UDP-N-acetylglucosamine 2-epimerase (non-hydrolyzing) [Chloroflexia bacterium]|nr:UDP-N-acetylglucosamine 2-epimerase (non-hydrolyzing) [Chloroflexia bacterium]